MSKVNECEVLQEFGTGLCPRCHRFKPTFEVLMPIIDRPDEILEGCQACIERVYEEVLSSDFALDYALAVD